MSNWREEVLDVIRKPEALTAKKVKNKFIMQAHVPPSFIYLIDRVTKKLDYSQASWMRRAVAVALSKQLGIPVSEILSTTSQVRCRGSSLPRYADPGYDDMTDLELFCCPGCDGSHLR